MAESELKQTHPATVVIRSISLMWQSAIGLFFVLVASGIGRNGIVALVGIGIFLGVVLGVGSSWLAWLRFGYGIVGDDLVVVEGLWVRKRRVIPVGRVHGVNIRADLLMRMLGLVEVVVQTAGGGSSEPEAKIGAITLADAEALRTALLHITPAEEDAPAPTSAQDPAADGEAPDALAQTQAPAIIGADPIGRMSDFRGAFGGRQAQAHEVSYEHRVAVRELVLAALTSNRVPIMFAVLLGVGAQLTEVVGLTAVEDTASTVARLAVPVLVAFALAMLVLVALAAVVAAVVKDYGFVARRIDRRIEIEAGLIERRMTGIPVSKVQSVRVEESWLRKLLGLAAVYVDTAGISHDQEANGGSSALIPALRASELPAIMAGLLPEAQLFPVAPGLAPRALRFYMFAPSLTVLLIGIPLVITLGVLWAPGYVAGGTVLAIVVGITAALRALAWRRSGIGVDDHAMTMRTGILGESRLRISRTRIQSLTVRQNPFQRRAGLATLVADSVSGSSRSRHKMAHIEEKRALRLMRWYENTRVGEPTAASAAQTPR